VRALLLGDRIDTSGLERTDVLSTTHWPSAPARRAW